MTLRLTDEEAAALRERARREGRSMQDVARAAVREYIDRMSRGELLYDLVIDVATGNLDDISAIASALRGGAPVDDHFSGDACCAS